MSSQVAEAHAIELDALRAHLWDVSSLLEDDGLHMAALDACAQEIADLLEMDEGDPRVDERASWGRKAEGFAS